MFGYPAYAAHCGVWFFVSDSHVTHKRTEELRLLEYSQSFALPRRNIATQVGASASTAVTL